MLAAYYSCGCYSRSCLQGSRLRSTKDFEKHLNQYDVIYLNMQQFLIEADAGNVIKYLEQEVLRELRKVYGQYLDREQIRFAAALREIFVETGDSLYS